MQMRCEQNTIGLSAYLRMSQKGREKRKSQEWQSETICE